ncbi:HD domain-containing protein [Vibrio diazotrophicus]|uniref:HD domain-containing protein n=1 Tax=Vibrio diazotrophicus TaxID=685 RepID=UPI00142E621D|nr:HD domain-containing protein [Vibrio diazotrophicus]NIY92023.1 HD domain-containing protein [Vibrio diazotrophicus]
MLNKQMEERLFSFIRLEMNQDLAHDIDHVLRVVKTAKSLCYKERAIEEVVIPAAYLHDCFSFEKNHPERSQSSVIAAEKAVSFLKSISYPSMYIDDIAHAIEAHSYSAKIEARTLEAKIVQDADRLDALGAIGVSRCLQVSSKLNRPLYSSEDSFCSNRMPDDERFTIDHFYKKLLKLEDSMNTLSAREEAKRRTAFMRMYLTQLENEVSETFLN